MVEPRLALIIPTRDRPELVQRLLASVAGQTRLPEQVIVVDGGSHSAESVCRQAGVPVTYLPTRPPSLTRQKNIGIQALRPDISLVGFLDDDLTLEPDALQAIAEFWRGADASMGGAGLTIQAPRSIQGVRVKRLFGLDRQEDGRVLRSGYNTPLRPHQENYTTQWLSGGASVWRREVVNRFQFDEWFRGYSYLEDVDYSLRVGRVATMAMVIDARAHHESSRLTWSQHLRFGVWQVRNRMYLAFRHPEISPWRCAWALVGQSGLNLTLGLWRWGLGGPLRVLGNLGGWLLVPRLLLDR